MDFEACVFSLTPMRDVLACVVYLLFHLVVVNFPRCFVRNGGRDGGMCMGSGERDSSFGIIDAPLF